MLTSTPVVAWWCRLHRPSASERQLLNLPESVERLNLHDAKHFMNGCGFSRGECTMACMDN